MEAPMQAIEIKDIRNNAEPKIKRFYEIFLSPEEMMMQ